MNGISHFSSKTIWTWLSIFLVVAGFISSWSIVKYRVEQNSMNIQMNSQSIQNNSKQIQKMVPQMAQIQTSQKGMKDDIKDIKGNVKNINNKIDKMYGMFIEIYKNHINKTKLKKIYMGYTRNWGMYILQPTTNRHNNLNLDHLLFSCDILFSC